jgi:hypothetical protein
MNKLNPVSEASHVRLHRWSCGLIAACALAGPLDAVADIVSDWNGTAETAIASAGATPGIYFGLVHLAIYDAVNSIDRKYTPYAVVPNTPVQGASREAAAAAAGYTMLIRLFPSQAPSLDPAYAASLDGIPDGAAEARGVEIGREVALRLLELRQGDGRDALPGSYTFQSGPGAYQRTPPAFLSPFLPGQVHVIPFAIDSAMQFRA